jgi:hypothetical protein
MNSYLARVNQREYSKVPFARPRTMYQKGCDYLQWSSPNGAVVYRVNIQVNRWSPCWWGSSRNDMCTSEYGTSMRWHSKGGRMCMKMIRTIFERFKVVCRCSNVFVDVQMCSQVFGHVCGCLHMFIGLCRVFPLHHPPLKAQHPNA